MRQNIIVVDDFYDNPEEVRDFSLNAEFPDPGDDYTYPGRNSEDAYYSEEIHRKFEDLAKEPLIPADKNGYFRLSLENASHKQDVHVDPSWEWGAVIYMSDPKDCVDEGGTSFWRHNTLKYENIPKTDFEAQHHGWPTYKECWWTMVYGCLLYTSPSPRDLSTSRMPSSA